MLQKKNQLEEDTSLKYRCVIMSYFLCVMCLWSGQGLNFMASQYVWLTTMGLNVKRRKKTSEKNVLKPEHETSKDAVSGSELSKIFKFFALRKGSLNI